jgi:hypothetical protein
MPALPPVVEPLMDSPVVVLLAAGPPACELPPALPPDDCAIATLDDKPRTAAKLIVFILIVSS